MREKLYYLGMYQHQPMRHTLSNNYVETNQARQNYIEGHRLDDYTVITLNQTSLDALLVKYDLDDLKISPQYTATYWQTLRARRLSEQQNKIADVQQVYLSQQPKLSWSLLNAMKLFGTGIKQHDKSMIYLLICVLIGAWANLFMMMGVISTFQNPHGISLSGAPLRPGAQYYGLLAFLIIVSLIIFGFICAVRGVIQKHQDDQLQMIKQQQLRKE